MTPDVIIVGAGIIGCAVAEALTWRGAHVEVIDPRGIGDGATQASAGMLAPHSEGKHDPWLAALGVRSMAGYEPLLARVSRMGDSPALFARPGSLELALNEEEAADLRQRVEALRAEGVESAFLPAASARELEPAITPDCAGALHVPSHGYARATALTNCLWEAAAMRGAQLTRAAVHRIDTGASGVRIHAADRVVAAGAVVLAAGSWAAQITIADLNALPIRPIRGQLLHLAWSEPPPTHIITGARSYALAWPDGTMLAGATVEDVGFDNRATAGGVGDLLAALQELVPACRNATFAGVRVGFRPMSPDARPIIGRSARVPGLVYAAGHFRNGVLLAPVTAELVAKALAGEGDPAFDGCHPRRFGEY